MRCRRHGDDPLEQLTQSAVPTADSGRVHPIVLLATVLGAFPVAMPGETPVVALGTPAVPAPAPSQHGDARIGQRSGR